VVVMPDANGKLTLVCLDWRSLERGTLLGFANVHIPAVRIVIRDVAIHARDGKRWAALPSKAQIGKDRELIRDDAGKIKYVPVLEFDNRKVADAFSEAALRAVDNFLARRGQRASSRELA
jgi:hypothetical protein